MTGFCFFVERDGVVGEVLNQEIMCSGVDVQTALKLVTRQKEMSE